MSEAQQKVLVGVGIGVVVYLVGCLLSFGLLPIPYGQRTLTLYTSEQLSQTEFEARAQQVCHPPFLARALFTDPLTFRMVLDGNDETTWACPREGGTIHVEQ